MTDEQFLDGVLEKAHLKGRRAQEGYGVALDEAKQVILNHFKQRELEARLDELKKERRIAHQPYQLKETKGEQ